MALVPPQRVRACNRAVVRGEGEFVVYWMIAARRARWNFGLQQAVDWAARLGKPLLVLEALRRGYRWASERLHRFVLQGMIDNARDLSSAPVTYYPYVEACPGDGRGLLDAVAARACVVVTDDFPCFFLPRMVAAVADRSPVLVEAVDSNGLLPLSVASSTFPTAYAFRRFLQRELPAHLAAAPRENPLAGVRLPRLGSLPTELRRRWPAAGADLLAWKPAARQALPIDGAVGRASFDGGRRAGLKSLGAFVADRLDRYSEARNHPDDDASSGLSPYLHFGHVSAHEVFAAIVRHEGWSVDRLSAKATGRREGWWNMRPAAEAFLDQLVTWRELGFHECRQRPDYDQYESLPDWARRTLDKHSRDRRPWLYSLEELEGARTHDRLWNAAQTQLVREGRLHNYLRMLWGKKILEWSPTPRAALDVLIELNNKYAVDGRDPNSYSGIFWCLGRYDRPWGPERPIFGTVRYMSSENTLRKVRCREYLTRYSADG